MKVTSWNLLHGQLLSLPGQSGANPSSPDQRELLLAAAGLLAVDLVGLQEVDKNQPRSGSHSQVEAIATAMGARDWAYARTVIGTPGEQWRALAKDEPRIESNHSPAFDSSPSYGIGLISKIPVRSWHHLELGKSRIGLPLAFPSEKGVRLIYVKDEPRIAIAAELANGFTVAVTHLSFVPLVNIYQLWKVQRWLSKLPGKKILIGDLNLPFNIPTRVSKWKSLNTKLTYPAWGAKIQFDYLLSDSISNSQIRALELGAPQSKSGEKLNLSDHLPISVEITEPQ